MDSGQREGKYASLGRMYTVYIAGPFRGADSWRVEQNIRRAEELAMAVAEVGFNPICPHTNTRFFNGTLTDEFWLAATMETLRRCDAVLFTEDWRRSVGARAELEEARRLGIPEFFAVQDLLFAAQSDRLGLRVM